MTDKELDNGGKRRGSSLSSQTPVALGLVVVLLAATAERFVHSERTRTIAETADRQAASNAQTLEKILERERVNPTLPDIERAIRLEIQEVRLDLHQERLELWKSIESLRKDVEQNKERLHEIRNGENG